MGCLWDIHVTPMRCPWHPIGQGEGVIRCRFGGTVQGRLVGSFGHAELRVPLGQVTEWGLTASPPCTADGVDLGNNPGNLEWVGWEDLK